MRVLKKGGRFRGGRFRIPPSLPARFKYAKPKLAFALALYAALGAIAAFALDGFLRAAVLLYFLILAVRTIAHSEDEAMIEPDRDEREG
jgi:hypothetical protein